MVTQKCKSLVTTHSLSEWSTMLPSAKVNKLVIGLRSWEWFFFTHVRPGLGMVVTHLPRPRYFRIGFDYGENDPLENFELKMDEGNRLFSRSSIFSPGFSPFTCLYRLSTQRGNYAANYPPHPGPLPFRGGQVWLTIRFHFCKECQGIGFTMSTR